MQGGASLSLLGKNAVEKFTNLPSIWTVDVFDTPENRVITSGLTLASFTEAIFGSSSPLPNVDKPEDLANRF